MRRLRPADGGTCARRRCRYELSALRSAPYRPADSTKSVPASDQEYRAANESRAIPIPLSATADPNRSIDLGPRSLCRTIYHDRRRDAGRRSLSWTNHRSAKTFAGRIDRGTQRNGDQHRNLFASFPSLLDDSAAVLPDWFILEFASSQRPSHRRAATLHRVRGYAVFATPD